MLFSLQNITKCFCLNINLNSSYSRKIIICVYDSDRTNTIFCFREFYLEKKGLCKINLPFYSKNIDVLIYDASNESANDFDATMTITEITDKTPIIIDEFTETFIKFAVEFSMICGYSKPSYFKNSGFEIRLLSKIPESSTPCRIESTESFIEVSKEKFDQTSVPARICLLLHEYSHNWLSDDCEDEFEADKKALFIYRAMNLPRIEAMYAFSLIFNDNNEARMKDIIDFLDIIYNE